MKISVRSPLMNDNIIALLDKQTLDDMSFNFLSKRGIEMFFDVDCGDKSEDEVVALVKKTIKDTNFGKAIVLSVIVCD